MEIWKKLERLPDYEISNQGRVRSSKSNKILKQATNNAGYKLVCLSEGNKKHTSYIHRLVAEVFIPTDHNKNVAQVNHKDKNRKNNIVDNLEWTSPLENYYHSRLKVDNNQVTKLAILLEKMDSKQITKVIRYCEQLISQ